MPIGYTLDHLVIAVRELAPATETYRKLLGRAPSWLGRHATYGTENALFRLDNSYIELLAPREAGRHPVAGLLQRRLEERGEGPFAVALGVRDIDAAVAALRFAGLEVPDAAESSGDDLATGAVRRWRNAILPLEATRGVGVLLIQHLSPPEALAPATVEAQDGAFVTGVDHLVVLASDLPTSRALWRDRLQVEVRLERDFPERGVRIIFMKLGDITLELVGRPDEEGSGHEYDRLWGVALRVGSLRATRERLVSLGFTTSEVRTGVAAGTSVVTLKAPQAHGVELLYIEHTS